MAPQSMGHDVNNISVPNLEISHSPNRPKYITPYSDENRYESFRRAEATNIRNTYVPSSTHLNHIQPQQQYYPSMNPAIAPKPQQQQFQYNHHSYHQNGAFQQSGPPSNSMTPSHQQQQKNPQRMLSQNSSTNYLNSSERKFPNFYNPTPIQNAHKQGLKISLSSLHKKL